MFTILKKKSFSSIYMQNSKRGRRVSKLLAITVGSLYLASASICSTSYNYSTRKAIPYKPLGVGRYPLSDPRPHTPQPQYPTPTPPDFKFIHFFSCF